MFVQFAQNTKIEQEKLKAFLDSEYDAFQSGAERIRTELKDIFPEEYSENIQVIKTQIKIICNFLDTIKNALLPLPKILSREAFLNHPDVKARQTARSCLISRSITDYLLNPFNTLKTTLEDLKNYLQQLSGHQDHIDETDRSIMTTHEVSVGFFEAHESGHLLFSTNSPHYQQARGGTEGHGLLQNVYKNMFVTPGIHKEKIARIDQLIDLITDWQAMYSATFSQSESSASLQFSSGHAS